MRPTGRLADAPPWFGSRGRAALLQAMRGSPASLSDRLAGCDAEFDLGTPSVALRVAASQRSSQSAETNETILRDGQGVGQAGERKGIGFRRTVSEVGGVLRATREAADAAVQRAKRFFFRDTG